VLDTFERMGQQEESRARGANSRLHSESAGTVVAELLRALQLCDGMVEGGLFGWAVGHGCFFNDQALGAALGEDGDSWVLLAKVFIVWEGFEFFAGEEELIGLGALSVEVRFVVRSG
jgi:hypothetical protein